MQKSDRKRVIERPSYVIESVDNALRLLELLRDVGEIRLSEAATLLGVANSTAHRLLAMLVYRGFAVQDERRRYHPGPALGAGPARQGWTRDFTDRLRPHLEALSGITGETTNLLIRVGTQARFLWSVESSGMLHVGDRRGQVLDAHRTAGGRALLSELPESTLEQLYLLPESATANGLGDNDVDQRLPRELFNQFRDDIYSIRDSGIGINLEQSEPGVAAFGIAVHNAARAPLGAMTISVPAAHYLHHVRGPLISQLRRAAREAELDIADIIP
ncbi:MAG: IclR family transcriptional regulator [Gordonia sp. (in: high G+C Gram-positive bacteria)]